MHFPKRRSSVSSTAPPSTPPIPSSPPTPSRTSSLAVPERPKRRLSINDIIPSSFKSSSAPPSPKEEIDSITDRLNEMHNIVEQSGVPSSVGRCVEQLKSIFELFQHNKHIERYTYRLFQDRVDSFKSCVFDRVYIQEEEFGFGSTSSREELQDKIRSNFRIGMSQYDLLESELKAYFATLKAHPKNVTEFNHVVNHLGTKVAIVVRDDKAPMKGKERASSPVSLSTPDTPTPSITVSG